MRDIEIPRIEPPVEQGLGIALSQASKEYVEAGRKHQDAMEAAMNSFVRIVDASQALTEELIPQLPITDYQLFNELRNYGFSVPTENGRIPEETARGLGIRPGSFRNQEGQVIQAEVYSTISLHRAVDPVDQETILNFYQGYPALVATEIDGVVVASTPDDGKRSEDYLFALVIQDPENPLLKVAISKSNSGDMHIDVYLTGFEYRDRDGQVAYISKHHESRGLNASSNTTRASVSEEIRTQIPAEIDPLDMAIRGLNFLKTAELVTE